MMPPHLPEYLDAAKGKNTLDNTIFERSKTKTLLAELAKNVKLESQSTTRERKKKTG